MTAKKLYCCGFLFNEERSHVLLIQKRRPEWQCGLLNGIGGKVEINEFPRDAMIRAFREEAGLTITSWEHFARLGGPDFQVCFYRAFDDRMVDAKTMTDEPLLMRRVAMISQEDVVPNLKVLIPLALDTSGIRIPVAFTDDHSQESVS